MKVRYNLLFLWGASLAMANTEVLNERDPFEIVQREKTEDVFIEEERPTFAEDIAYAFDNDNTHVFGTETSEVEEHPRVASEESVVKGAPIKVTGSRTQDAMLAKDWNGVKANSYVLDDIHWQDILWVTQYLYFATKRWTEDEYIYKNAFDDVPGEKPLGWEELKKNNIKIAAPIHGTDGEQAEAIIGMLAYRDLRAEKGLLELFVAFKGSQGESFEPLGGIGGPSWLTNFQAGKYVCDAQKLGLDEKNGKLSFHKGYYRKVYTSKKNWENALRKLFNDLKIKEISNFKSQKPGEITQQDVDNWRGCRVKCYIFGHSQGGGLTQIGAPYITTFLGRWLYGNSFDNKTFNICHAICMSPARAIGDKHTMDVLLDVMGEGNIFGYCSPIDVVTCLPLGNNARKDTRVDLILKILDKLNSVLPKDFQSLVSIVRRAEFIAYETLPNFAYVDCVDLFKKYCENGKKVFEKYLEMQQSLKQYNPKFEVSKEEIQERLDKLAQIEKKLPDIKEHIEKMQEHYFKAHSSWVSKYHIAKAVYHLVKLEKIVGLTTLIAVQHWGMPIILHHPDLASNATGEVYRGYRMDELFSRDMVKDQMVQNCLDRGTAYEKHKKKLIGE